MSDSTRHANGTDDWTQTHTHTHTENTQTQTHRHAQNTHRAHREIATHAQIHTEHTEHTQNTHRTHTEHTQALHRTYTEYTHKTHSSHTFAIHLAGVYVRVCTCVCIVCTACVVCVCVCVRAGRCKPRYGESQGQGHPLRSVAGPSSAERRLAAGPALAASADFDPFLLRLACVCACVVRERDEQAIELECVMPPHSPSSPFRAPNHTDPHTTFAPCLATAAFRTHTHTHTHTYAYKHY
jgi:hypothetical protein